MRTYTTPTQFALPNAHQRNSLLALGAISAGCPSQIFKSRQNKPGSVLMRVCASISGYSSQSARYRANFSSLPEIPFRIKRKTRRISAGLLFYIAPRRDCRVSPGSFFKLLLVSVALIRMFIQQGRGLPVTLPSGARTFLPTCIGQPHSACLLSKIIL